MQELQGRPQRPSEMLGEAREPASQGETADPEEPLCSLCPKQRRHFIRVSSKIPPPRCGRRRKKTQKPGQCRLMVPQIIRGGWALCPFCLAQEKLGRNQSGSCSSRRFCLLLLPHGWAGSQESQPARHREKVPGLTQIILDARPGHS